MSKLWKGVKKVFKKVVKFVKKNWKIIVIAAAVYFTAGIALAAMPSTAAFSAAMPGFGVGGMFSNAAVALGATGAAGSGIAGTVAANAAAAAAAAGGAGAAISGAGVTTAGATAMPTAVTTAATATGAPIAGTATTGALASTTATIAPTVGKVAAVGMTGMEKVAMASAIFQGAGALLSPDEDKLDKKAHARRYGQSFGMGRDGEGPGWGGAVSDAFGDKYGGEKQQEAGIEGDANVFAATPPPQGQEGNPFGDMSSSEQAAQQDKATVGGGFKRGSYMPT